MSAAELNAGERLQIQMAYAVPLLKRLQGILGKDVVLDALREDTHRRTEEAAEIAGGPRPVSKEWTAKGFEMFGGNGLLDYELIATDAHDVRVDVHRCAHAELMKELGGEEIGAILLCGEDHIMAARAGIRLDRPSTIMQGASICGFHYLPGKGAE